MLRKNSTLAILLALIVLSSCAALKLTTWVVDKGELHHGLDRKSALEAQGFRCYDETDDTAWRTELKIQAACCASKTPTP